MEDSKIIELFFERSESAIIELSKKYGSLCNKIAENFLDDPLDREECVNSAFLGVWNSVPPQRPSPLVSYIARIVRNLAIKKYRQNHAAKRNGSFDIALDELENCFPDSNSVENEIYLMEISSLINEFLAKQNKESRVIFVLRYWYCFSVADIAKQVGLQPHNVSVKLSRTREKLKSYLLKKGVSL